MSMKVVTNDHLKYCICLSYLESIQIHYEILYENIFYKFLYCITLESTLLNDIIKTGMVNLWKSESLVSINIQF